MSQTPLLQAQYPIANTDDYLTVRIAHPVSLPPMTAAELATYTKDQGERWSTTALAQWAADLAAQSDIKVAWTLTAPDYSKEGYAIGVDALQATLLAFQNIAAAITAWERATGHACEYHFGTDLAITHTSPVGGDS